MEQEDQTIDLGRYLGVAIKWWWALALVTFLCIVLAFVYSTVTKSTVYTARATILVQDSRSASSPTLGNIGGSRELATTYKELITTPRLLEMVRNELNIPLDDESIPTKVSVSIRPGTALLDVEVQGGHVPSSGVRVRHPVDVV